VVLADSFINGQPITYD